ncbi:MAG: hypothetical protein KGL39_55160 [Patescibacteria group bacterium]|nr:hypothetical protein [Patescibacteria group bacterium]
MRRFILPAFLLLAATPALAQTLPAEKVDQTVRGAVAGLSQAQTMLLQIPDLVAQINALNAEIAALKKQLAAAKKKPAALPEKK